MALSARSFVAKPVVSRATSARAGARSAVCRVVARDAPYAPGTTAPAYLNGTLPGDFGFDPLGLGSDPELLAKFRENEVIHGRWAMLGAAGIIAVEATGAGNWIDAQTWPITGGKPSYLGNQVGVSDPLLLVAFELAALGFVEKLRGAESGEKRIYPGGSFDPLGMSKDAKAFEEAKLKEIKNGRLAMIACMGMFSQGAVTHDGVLTALGKHLANPWGYNVATSNSIAIPPFHAADFVLGNDSFWKAALPAFMV